MPGLGQTSTSSPVIKKLKIIQLTRPLHTVPRYHRRLDQHRIKMRTAAIVVMVAFAVISCGMAAPALKRTARQAEPPSEAMLMGIMRSGLKVLSRYSVSR